ncbi:hypothetical protein N566_14205 [Streptomycetaceae bacterium MP113-05]|nr:hypothetical protein N566_14205 [Streptomycetaceae bacterium MP113-05]
MESAGSAADAPPTDATPAVAPTPEPGRTAEVTRGSSRAESDQAGTPLGAAPLTVSDPWGSSRPPAEAPRGRGTLAALVAADCLAATSAALSVGSRSHLALLGLAPMLLTLVALHQQGGLYRSAPHGAALGDLPALLWRAALAWCATTTVVVAVRPEFTPDWTLLLSVVLVHTTLAVALRAALHGLRIGRQRRRPRSALVVGDVGVGRVLAAVLHEHPEYGMCPVGLVAPHRPDVAPRAAGGRDPAQARAACTDEGPPLPVLSATDDVTRAVIQNAVRDAVLTSPAVTGPETTALIRLFGTLGVAVWVVDGETVPGDVVWRTTPAGHVWGFPCARVEPSPRPAAAHIAKRLLDLTLAAVALIAAAPVLALCAWVVRASDGPGVLFRQERVGWYGRPFTMLKFRTLRPATEHESATRWNVADDQRMSGVGRFLRRTSLDELPQLWNVLRGDMSLVGPRPERPFFVQQFSKAHPGYAARDRMPVGITGLAQVNGLRGDTSIEARARFDNHYIDTWSFWQDVQILLRTAGSFFHMGGS